MHAEAPAAPLTASVEAPGRVALAIAGSLTKDALPALRGHIADAERCIREAAEGSASGKARILLDMSRFSGKYDAESLEAMAAFAKANALFVAKTAVFGAPDTGAIATEVVAALAGRENIRVFPARAEAGAWLAQ